MPTTPNWRLSYVQLAIADTEAEIAGRQNTKLKSLVAALKTAITADAAALDEVIKVAADLRAKQAELKKASAAIDDQVNKISTKLGAVRAEQGDKTAAAVAGYAADRDPERGRRAAAGRRAGMVDRRQRVRPDPQHDRPDAIACRGRARRADPGRRVAR